MSSQAGKPAPGEQLMRNTQLSGKVQTLLPANTNVTQASSGFRNLGQFVAAAHVSHNLGIPFDQLKAQMVDGKSLGSAIHALRPDVNARAEAKRANGEAKVDMKASAS